MSRSGPTSATAGLGHSTPWPCTRWRDRGGARWSRVRCPRDRPGAGRRRVSTTVPRWRRPGPSSATVGLGRSSSGPTYATAGPGRSCSGPTYSIAGPGRSCSGPSYSTGFGISNRAGPGHVGDVVWRPRGTVARRGRVPRPSIPEQVGARFGDGGNDRGTTRTGFGDRAGLGKRRW